MDFDAEIFNRLGLLISSVGVILGVFLGMFLLLKKSNRFISNLFLAIYILVFSLRMIKSLFYGYYSINETIHYIFLISVLLIGPSLWCYTKLIRGNFIKKKTYYLHFVPFIVLIGVSWSISYSGRSIFHLLLFVHGLIYSLVVLYTLLNFKSTQKENTLQWTKLNHWLFLLTFVAMAMFSNSILIFFDVLPFYPSSAFLYSFCMVVLLIYGLKNLWIFEPQKVKYANSNLDEQAIKVYYQKLKEIMERDKVYLDTELTLSKLSKLVGISSKQLSQIINQTKRANYSQYIMRYRVNEAKKLLKDPEYRDYKISTIAYDSGFNSISSFNTAFKKITNTTAAQYRNKENEY